MQKARRQAFPRSRPPTADRGQQIHRSLPVPTVSGETSSRTTPPAAGACRRGCCLLCVVYFWGIALRPLVSVWFQVQCPPLVGVLPIVRSRYWCTIGRQRVLSLAGWAPQIRTDFHVSGPTQVPNRRTHHAAYGTFTRYGRSFQNVPLQ